MLKTRLKYIGNIFEIKKDIGIPPTSKYYYNDLFDMFYDMDIDELQQYQYDMENEKQFRMEDLTLISKNHANS